VSKTDRRARSRLPLSRSRSGACQSVLPCWAVNQFPNLTPSFFHALDAPDSGRQVGAQETTVRGLVRQTANRPQPEIDSPGCEVS
jgi:hypothetical protein